VAYPTGKGEALNCEVNPPSGVISSHSEVEASKISAVGEIEISEITKANHVEFNTQDVLAGPGPLLADEMWTIRNSAGSSTRCSLRTPTPGSVRAAVCSRRRKSNRYL
jgi:hypothetical protein